ncbi:MAG: glycosyltransferase, partial [Bacteroidota bacterium]
MPRVSVIIVTWNGRALLEQCLPSVLATDFESFEVVVADNASTDDTVAWLAATHPEVRVIQHRENWLFARGNNEAIRHTESDYVCLLNNDVDGRHLRHRVEHAHERREPVGGHLH